MYGGVNMITLNLDLFEDEDEDFDLCIEVYEDNSRLSQSSYNREIECDAIPMSFPNREEW